MNVIFGIDYISRKNTGISSLVENLSDHLNKRGHSTYIAAVEDKYSQTDSEKFTSAKLLLLKKEPKLFSAFKCFRKYLGFFLRSNADIAHMHSLWSISSIAIYYWSNIRNRPYIISTNGMLNEWALDQSKLKKKVFLGLIFRRIIRGAESIILNSTAEKDYLEMKGWHDKFHIIPNGVVIPSFHDETVVKKTSGRKTLLFLSRIHIKKGVDILLDAWSELHDLTIDKNWHLHVVGFLDREQNEYERYIAEKIKNSPTLSNVTTSEGKFGKQMWDEYYSSDAFVLPTFSEGSAMVVLNAWSAGKICLTTAGSNLEIGLDEKCTILIEPNIESVKEGIFKLLSLSDEQRKDFGMLGQKIVKDNYTWEKIVDQHLEIYQNAIDRIT